MKVDFSNVKNVVSGSMTTAKAALLFYPPGEEVVQVLDADTGSPATPAEGLQKAVKSAAEQAYFTVTFQFNPASLHISAYGGGMAPNISFKAKEGQSAGNTQRESGGQVDYGPIDETVTVSFKAVFDAVNNEKAFPSDRANLGPTNLARQGVGLIRSKQYTVRPLVEGFLAAVRNSSTRRVIFQWGELRYGGYLNRVQCRYTMFDIEGEAVRAEVDLALVCSCHKDYDNGKKWRDHYNAFMDKQKDAFNLSNKKWQALFRAMFGWLEKACILFRTEVKEPEKGAKAGLNSVEINGLSQMAEAIANEAQNPANKKKGKAAKKTGEAEKGTEGAAEEEPGLSKKVEAAGYAPVRIHYNPASVSIYSRGGEMVTREGNPMDSLMNARFQHNAMPTETVLSMELFFDETDNANAFMMDAGMSSPTGLAWTGKNMVSRVAGRECSVAPISELFVAATATANSRLVCFVWNKMVFWGELCEVEVEYTMFNNRGNPIRSKVSIRIRQDGDPEKCGSYEKLWQNAYDNLPKEAEKLASDKGLTGSSWNHIASNLFHM